MKKLLETYERMYELVFAGSWQSFASFAWILTALHVSTAFTETLTDNFFMVCLIGVPIFVVLALLPIVINKLIKK